MSDTPKVHNKYHNTAPEGAVYIGRGSKWGNPFKLGDHGNRDDVCEAYKAAVLDHPTMVQDIKKELKGKHLICFCKPKRCHGDFLLELANE